MNLHLGNHLTKLIKGRGETQSAIAEEIGVTHNTLRQDLSKNQFYSEDLIALCSLLGLDTDLERLHLAYEFRLKTNVRARINNLRLGLGSPDALFTGLNSSISPGFMPVSTFLSKVFQVSGESTLLICFLSDNTPAFLGYNFTGGKMFQYFLDAIGRGCHIVCLYPGEVIQHHLRLINPRILTPEQAKHGFNRLERRVRDATEMNGSRWAGIDAGKQLILLPHENPFICRPFVDQFLVTDGIKMFGAATVPIKGKSSQFHTDYPIFGLCDEERRIMVSTFEDAVAKVICTDKVERGGRFAQKVLGI